MDIPRSRKKMRPVKRSCEIDATSTKPFSMYSTERTVRGSPPCPTPLGEQLYQSSGQLCVDVLAIRQTAGHLFLHVRDFLGRRWGRRNQRQAVQWLWSMQFRQARRAFQTMSFSYKHLLQTVQHCITGRRPKRRCSMRHGQLARHFFKLAQPLLWLRLHG